jgi:hypothetical protein
MPVSALLYGKLFLNAFGGETAGETLRNIDILSDSIKLMLTTSAYVPDQHTHKFKSSVTNEVVGAGYTAGGIALANRTWAYNSGTKTCTFDADDVVWSNATITARIAVLYDSTPAADADRILIGYVDFGTDQVSTQPGSFTVQWAAAGVATFQVA